MGGASEGEASRIRGRTIGRKVGVLVPCCRGRIRPARWTGECRVSADISKRYGLAGTNISAGTPSERAWGYATADRISKNNWNALPVIGVGNGCDPGELPAAIHKAGFADYDMGNRTWGVDQSLVQTLLDSPFECACELRSGRDHKCEISASADLNGTRCGLSGFDNHRGVVVSVAGSAGRCHCVGVLETGAGGCRRRISSGHRAQCSGVAVESVLHRDGLVGQR